MTSISQKPKITRIEFRVYPIHHGAVQVSKFLDGWTARSNPSKRSLQVEYSLEDMLGILEQSGEWTIYRWPACKEFGVAEGATAFRGRPVPKFTRKTIIENRNSFEAKLQKYYERFRGWDPLDIPRLPIDIKSVDFAYMF